jgi:hypothetical protein
MREAGIDQKPVPLCVDSEPRQVGATEIVCEQATCMSALGQKRTFAPQKVMSALPPKADIGAAQINVRYGAAEPAITLMKSRRRTYYPKVKTTPFMVAG